MPPSPGYGAGVFSLFIFLYFLCLSTGKLKNPEELKSSFQGLLADETYRSAIEKATAREENVILRIDRAKEFLLD